MVLLREQGWSVVISRGDSAEGTGVECGDFARLREQGWSVVISRVWGAEGTGVECGDFAQQNH